MNSPIIIRRISGTNFNKEMKGQEEALRELEKMINGEEISLKTPNSPQMFDPFSYGDAELVGETWRTKASDNSVKLDQCNKKLNTFKKKMKEKNKEYKKIEKKLNTLKKELKKKKKNKVGGCGNYKGGGTRKRKGNKDLLTKLQKKNIQRLNKCEKKHKKNKSKCKKEFQNTWTKYNKFLKKNHKKQYTKKQYTKKQQRKIIKQFF